MYVYADLGALTTPKPANLLELAVNWQPFLMKVITKFDCSDFRTGCMECQIPRKSVNIAKQLYYIGSEKLFCNRTKSDSENNTYMYTCMCIVLEIVVRHQTLPTIVNVHLNIFVLVV